MALRVTVSKRVSGAIWVGIRTKHYQVLTVGGGCGGLAVSSTLSKNLGKGAVRLLVHLFRSFTRFSFKPYW